MPSDINERLAELEAELARQDREWEATRRAIARLGNTPVEVPQNALDHLDALCRRAVSLRPAIRA